MGAPGGGNLWRLFRTESPPDCFRRERRSCDRLGRRQIPVGCRYFHAKNRCKWSRSMDDRRSRPLHGSRQPELSTHDHRRFSRRDCRLDRLEKRNCQRHGHLYRVPSPIPDSSRSPLSSNILQRNQPIAESPSVGRSKKRGSR